MVFIISCNLEVNTSDGQESTSINNSKQDGFFISEYDHSAIPDQIFDVSEAWVEHIWFNKILDGKVARMKSNGTQLNFKLNKFSNSRYADDKYLLDWRMKDDFHHYAGEGNGIYSFSLGKDEAPDTIHISILKINDDRSDTKVYEFLLFKKK